MKLIKGLTTKKINNNYTPEQTEEETLFQRHQPMITRVIYKFSYIGGYKKTEDAWNHYLGLEFKGIGINDLYQEGEIILINTIRNIKNKKVHNVGAYLFKALYRQLKYYITKQSTFTGLDSVYKKLGEPEDLHKTEDTFAHQELKKIIMVALNNLGYRKKHVIENLYGLNGNEIKSMAALGRSMGISYQGVQSLQRTSFKEIKKNKILLENLKYFT